MQNHNEYLKQIEDYLMDLTVSERISLLQEIQAEISDKSVQELEDAQIYTNKKRLEHGHIKYVEVKKFSLVRFLTKSFAILTVCTFLFFGFVIWKFTPILKVDEENNKVTILGGLIDIDGKAGKIKLFDETHFTQDKYTNDLQASFTLEQDKDDILIKFKSGQFTLKNSESKELTLNCKLASPADEKMIIQEDDFIEINFLHIDGATCEVLVPENKKLVLEGSESAINILNPEFNIYIELNGGSVAITPALEIDYKYNLNVDDGYVGEFQSSTSEEAYEIQIQIKKGSIVTK